MPTSPFTITTGSTAVVLNAERKGAAAFTVTNVSGQALRGRAGLVPLGQTAAGWLAIAGVAERDFGIGATQQYAVQVAVPMDAAPGDYTFRLDAVGVDNPDETFTQGPVVTFQVAPLPVPVPPPKPFPWRIVAAAAGVIVLVVLGAIVLPPLLTPPGNFGGAWMTNFAQVELTQNGRSITGSIKLYGAEAPAPSALEGTINGNTLTGHFGPDANRNSFSLTLAPNGGNIDGFWTAPGLESDRRPWCGVRSGALLEGCGFSGRWNIVEREGGSACGFADLVQIGAILQGTLSGCQISGRVSGSVSSDLISGSVATSRISSPQTPSRVFQSRLVDFRSDQFRGNTFYDPTVASFPLCGFRNGSVPPNPCFVEPFPY